MFESVLTRSFPHSAPSSDLGSGALATVTSPAVTAFGVILGTAAYRSPEQACGQNVDRSSDIWAFGAVLFEMLTGARAFEGNDPTQSQLFRVSAASGEQVPQTTPPPAGGHRFPCFLPDGKHFLFFVSESRAVFWGSLDGSPARQLLDADAAAVFAPPSEVVFVRDGVLYAQGFDATRLELTGNPIKLASGVAASSAGVAAISASREVIAYRTGAAARERQFVWFDRSGKRLREIGKPADTQLNPALSPDGRQLLFTHGGTSFEYDVTADGKEFLVNTFVEHPAVPISLILNRRPVAG